MSDNISLGAITREKAHFFVNTNKIIGLQSLNVETALPVKPLVYLGMGTKNKTFADGQLFTNLSVESFLINNDPFYEFVTGENLFSAFLLQKQSDINNNCYSLISGYLNSYSCRYSVGTIPSINVNATFIDNAGQIPTGKLRTPDFITLKTIQTGVYTGHLNALIPYSNSISATFDNSFLTNRVVGFDLTLNPVKTPIYNMGSKKPSRVEIIYPIEVNFSISYEMGQYTPKTLMDFPSGQNLKSLTLDINSHDTNIRITSYSFSNLELVSEVINESVDNNFRIDSVFKTMLLGN